MIWLVCFALAVIAVAYCFYENNALMVSQITIKNKKLPKSFSGYKILQVSDLHNKLFGAHQTKLIEETGRQAPNIIVITGDLIDKRRTTAGDLTAAVDYVEKALEFAPVYYVPGNHEAVSHVYPELKQRLQKLGVKILEENVSLISKADDTLCITGLSDVADSEYIADSSKWAGWYDKTLSSFVKPRADFNILLAHRPEMMEVYARYGYDLIFSGHAHGGQIRLPLIGPLFAPSQGVFPKYTSGVHEIGDAKIVISRGLGNSIFPVRVGNRPELVCVTLESLE